MQTKPLVSSYFLADILPLHEQISIRLEQKLEALKTTYGARMDIKRAVCLSGEQTLRAGAGISFRQKTLS